MMLGPKLWSLIGSNRDTRKSSMKWTTTGANQRADPCRAAARHHHIVLYVRIEQSFKDTENYMLMLEQLVLLYRTVLTDTMEQ